MLSWIDLKLGSVSYLLPSLKPVYQDRNLTIITSDPVGTTRMSKNIEQGVVDAHLRVHGIKKLRVIDASVMPVIPDCRPQNSVYMVAEKASDMIKSEYPNLF
jgi:choline dehydrogenase-like flavoprotein